AAQPAPMTRDDIPTPALLLDLDRFERNLRRMAAHARASGKNLRPHAKTHRCPEIARRQVSAGALGVACTKLGEAEVMARAGVRGLLITTEVVAHAAIRRLMRLVSAAPDTLVVIDNPANVADLGREASADGVTVNVLVDVDVGTRRTGIAPGEPALALARAAVAQPSLRFRGLQGYAGHCAHVMGWEARREASHAALKPLMETRELIERAGLPVEIVAGGEHGRLTVTDPSRAPRLGERIEFFPPHCDPTINLYDRIYAMRGDKVEAVWDIAARGRSD